MATEVSHQRKAHCRATDPETSKEAADALSDEILRELDGRIVGLIAAASDGLTELEVTGILGKEYRVSISPRFAPLRRMGLIHDTGIRRVGEKGRRAIVYQSGPGPKVELSKVSMTELSNKITTAAKRDRGVRLGAEEVRQIYALLILHT